jgi:hypothetical protein
VINNLRSLTIGGLIVLRGLERPANSFIFKIDTLLLLPICKSFKVGKLKPRWGRAFDLLYSNSTCE